MGRQSGKRKPIAAARQSPSGQDSSVGGPIMLQILKSSSTWTNQNSTFELHPMVLDTVKVHAPAMFKIPSKDGSGKVRARAHLCFLVYYTIASLSERVAYETLRGKATIWSKQRCTPQRSPGKGAEA